jgi:hypothetical protein
MIAVTAPSNMTAIRLPQKTFVRERKIALSLLRQRQRASLAGELVAIVFMGLIAEAAHKTVVTLLLFPELAALSYDVLTRPQGKWASQPLRLILTPTLTAVVGLLVTRHAHYGAIHVLLIVLAGLAIIRLLRSSIGPALSAGVLPMVLDERHWMYPVAICIGLTGLVLLLWTWQRYGAAMEALEEQPTDASIDGTLETNPTGRFWLFHLLVCLAKTPSGISCRQTPRVFTVKSISHSQRITFWRGTRVT